MAVVHPKKSFITEKLFRGSNYGGNSGHVIGHRKLSRELEDDDFEEGDDAMELTQIGADRTKNVLILMSDTGGGHRASAEAIRAAFQMEFGDEYQAIGSIQMLFDFITSYYLLKENKKQPLDAINQLFGSLLFCGKENLPSVNFIPVRNPIGFSMPKFSFFLIHFHLKSSHDDPEGPFSFSHCRKKNS